MTLLEFLDRHLARRAENPRPARDIRQFIGFAFLAGYYLMVWRFIDMRSALPETNLALIRDAMLTLGPPVGLIVGAMFRSDLRDEQSARNTGEVIKVARDMAANASASAGSDANLRAGDTVELNRSEDPK